MIMKAVRTTWCSSFLLCVVLAIMLLSNKVGVRAAAGGGHRVVKTTTTAPEEEDQKGLEWHMQNIGTIKSIAYDGIDKYYIASDRAVVARINIHTGKLDWRQVLEEGVDDVDAITVVQTHVITLSGGGRRVRLWNAADGLLLWETALRHPLPPLASPSSPPVWDCKGHTYLHTSSDGSDVVVVCANHVFVLRTSTGTQMLRYTADPEADTEMASAISSDASIVITDIHSLPGGNTRMAGYSIKGGANNSKTAKAEALMQFEWSSTTRELTSQAVKIKNGLAGELAKTVLLVPHPQGDGRHLLVGSSSGNGSGGGGGGSGGASHQATIQLVVYDPTSSAVSEVTVKSPLCPSSTSSLTSKSTSSSEEMVVVTSVVPHSAGRLIQLTCVTAAEAANGPTNRSSTSTSTSISTFVLLTVSANGAYDFVPVGECSSSSSRPCALGASFLDDQLFVSSVTRVSDRDVIVNVSEVMSDGSALEVTSFKAPLDETERGRLRQVFPYTTSSSSAAIPVVVHAAMVVSGDTSTVWLQPKASLRNTKNVVSGGDGGGEEEGEEEEEEEEEEGAVVWVREEALSDILQVDFVDLHVPLLENDGAHKIPDAAMRFRMQKQLLEANVQRIISWLTVGGTGGPASVADPRAEDFGFKKLAVCITRSGKLVGLRVDTGEVEWARMLQSATGETIKVYSTRPTAVLGYGPQFALVYSGVPGTSSSAEDSGSKKGGGGRRKAQVSGRGGQADDAGLPGRVVWCDGLTGEEVERQTVKGDAKLTSPLPLHDHEDRQVLMIVNSDNEITLAPETPQTRSQLEAFLPSVFYHELNAPQNSGVGGGGSGKNQLMTYAVVRSNNDTPSTSSSSPPLVGVLAGSFVPPAAESIVAVAYPPRREVIQTPAHVLGDQSLLLKYLNPHVMLIATMTMGGGEEGAVKAAAGGGGGGNGQFISGGSGGGDIDKDSFGTRLTISLVDSVSARLLHRVQHENVGGAVHAVMVENWAVYSYWNAKATRQEIGVLSLYEGMIERRGLGPFKRPEYATHFSSFESHPPIVLQKTFVFPHVITALGTTVTLHGVTRTAILVGFKGGQILSLDKAWLDPRRPVGEPSKTEKAERLIQYQPFLPATANSVITHDKVVARLRDIYSEPAALESTALVLATGLDVLGTRVVPSRSFDHLPADFNFSFLCIAVLFIMGVAILTENYVKRKELNAAWE